MSESIVGDWLAQHLDARRRITVATKILPPFEPHFIESSVRHSLRRLRVAKIDLLYVHQWHASLLALPVLRSLDELIVGGLVGELGLSNVEGAQVDAVVELQRQNGLHPISLVQNNNNYAVRKVDAALRETCARRNIRILTYSPLGAGFLTGKHSHGAVPGSRFDIAPAHQSVYFQPTSLQRLKRLQAVSELTGRGMSELALAWAFGQQQVDTVLIGCRTLAHIEQALAARRLASDELLRLLDEGPDRSN